MSWASVLCGASLYLKGRSIPTLVGALAAQLRLSEGIRHVWIVDRGIISRPLLRALQALSQFALGRVRANQVVYFAPRRQPKRGRKKTYRQKCRADQLLRRFPDRLRKRRGELICPRQRAKGRDLRRRSSLARRASRARLESALDSRDRAGSARDHRVAGQKSKQQDKNRQRAETDARSVELPFENDQTDDQVIAVRYNCPSHNEDSLRMNMTAKYRKIIRRFFTLFCAFTLACIACDELCQQASLA